MSTPMIVLIVVLVVLVAAAIGLYFLGKRLEKKRAEQDEQMAAVAQTIPMLVIDKKKMKLKDAGCQSQGWSKGFHIFMRCGCLR